MQLLPGCFVPPKSLQGRVGLGQLHQQKARVREPVQLVQKPCQKVHWVALPVDEKALAACTHHGLQELVWAHLRSDNNPSDMPHEPSSARSQVRHK